MVPISDVIDYSKTQEPSRNRFEVREAEVYDDFYDINRDKFFGIKEYIKITSTTPLIKRCS